MKKFTAIILTAVLMLCFLVGCGDKLKLYSGVNLDDYVKLGEYKNIKIDTTTDSFKEYYNDVLQDDIEKYNLYSKLEEGTVQNGDIINLDYEGKIDGVAFSGGTAQGADLEIGSHTFIDDFEEQLIGATVGETRVITVTFPQSYGNESLNGKDADFTCTINYISRPLTPEEAYKELKFSSLEEYTKDVKKRAVEINLTNKVCGNAKISNYPETTVNTLCEAIVEMQKAMFAANNQDLESYLSAYGMSLDTFKQQLKSSTIPQMMDVSMVMYAILDAENLEVLESTIESQNIDNELLAESYAVQDTVVNFLYENADIK